MNKAPRLSNLGNSVERMIQASRRFQPPLHLGPLLPVATLMISLVSAIVVACLDKIAFGFTYEGPNDKEVTP
jgi:hypothetical protein